MIVDASEVLLELGLSASCTEEERAVVIRCIEQAEGAVKRWIGYDPTLLERTEYHPQQAYQSQISRGIWEVMEQRAVLRQVSESATNELQLQHVPVRSMDSLYVDYDGRSDSRASSFPESSKKTEGQDYWVNYNLVDSQGAKACQDGILRSLGLWPTTPGTVKVVYTGGYTPAELRGQDSILDASPIYFTIVEEAARRAKRIFLMKKGSLGWVGPKTSESFGDYSYSIDTSYLQKLFSGELTAESMQRLSRFVNFGFSIGG